jgi:hypothetical protein
MRPVLACILAVPFLTGCAFFGFGSPRPAPVDPSEAVYRAAMADLSLCATSLNPAEQSAAALRLAQAAQQLQAEMRPTNPDHFFMTDRVAGAAEFCAATAR